MTDRMKQTAQSEIQNNLLIRRERMVLTPQNTVPERLQPQKTF